MRLFAQCRDKPDSRRPLPEPLIAASHVLKNMEDDLGENGDDKVVELDEDNWPVMEHVIYFYQDSAPVKAVLSTHANTELLCATLIMANYLHLTELLEWTCAEVARQCTNKTPDEIRAHFQMSGPFTRTIEEFVRNETEYT